MRHLRDGLAWCGALSTRRRRPATLSLRPIRAATRLRTSSPAEIRSVEVQREAENGLEFVQKSAIWCHRRHDQRTARAHPDASRPDAGFRICSAMARSTRRQFEQHLEDDPRLVYAGWRYWIRKLQARFYAGDYGAAVAAATKAQRLLSKSPSLLAYFEAAEYHFYGALARAAACDSAPVRRATPAL